MWLPHPQGLSHTTRRPRDSSRGDSSNEHTAIAAGRHVQRARAADEGVSYLGGVCPMGRDDAGRRARWRPPVLHPSYTPPGSIARPSLSSRARTLRVPTGPFIYVLLSQKNFSRASPTRCTSPSPLDAPPFLHARSQGGALAFQVPATGRSSCPARVVTVNAGAANAVAKAVLCAAATLRALRRQGCKYGRRI
ncbi:hypothetical protein K466DRAFT_587842 [Polyporus arcularius HHB13444]|uniref:Uncharacterized protein n=1 Tax=Polyporus arcularius HHB13444 TaxID=1314778 RepID=A0A5C3P924_9APHY|nr:hypothetical protein K466DRAFT_587842 [Polyporus arcularius HHB13444]